MAEPDDEGQTVGSEPVDSGTVDDGGQSIETYAQGQMSDELTLTTRVQIKMLYDSRL